MSYWSIWFKTFINGKPCGSGVVCKIYKTKGRAEWAALRRFGREIHTTNGSKITYEWVISQTNPWTSESKGD